MSARADRVVIVVLDGLRPDMIDAAATPNLAAFARESVRFSESRSVFPSMTRVATTATATGCWPRRHGIVNNSFHIPHLLTGKAIDTSEADHIKRLEADAGGPVHALSLGERLAAAGRRMGAVHCGSAGSAFLINHRVADNGHWTFSVHGPSVTRTPEAVLRAVAEIGPLPREALPKLDTVAYAADVALRYGLGADGPDLLVVWLPEPDTSYHYRELGSAETRQALAAADRSFGRIADAARSGPRGARTAVIAMSDHGQITTTGHFDIETALRADGFAAAVEPGPDDQIALTLGRSGEVRLLGDDAGLRAALASWLMERDEIGMLFARDAHVPMLEGTLPLSAVSLDHQRAADLFYVARCETEADVWDLPGRGLATGGPPVGGGMHGGLNKRELATTLMISAPGGPKGVVDPRPCGLVDIAPTALGLLGLDFAGCDGAPLPVDGKAPSNIDVEEVVAGRAAFRQRLVRRSIGGRVYLAEGGRA